MHISDLYNQREKEEVIRWENEDGHGYFGFSVIREYPDDCGFVSPKNKEAVNDAKVLIKIGYRKDSAIDGKIELYVTVSKFSKYLSTHYRYNFEDPESPTKESIQESEKSSQPVDLEDRDRFFYIESEGLVFDKENKKNISFNELVDDLYGLHLKTIKGIRAVFFKVRSSSKVGMVKFLGWLFGEWSKYLIVANELFFGKILPPKKDFLEGYYKPYSHNDLISVYPEVIPFFSSNLQISKKCVVWVSSTVLLLWIYLVVISSPLREANETLTIAFIICLVTIFDTVVPHTVLFLANLMIRIRAKIEFANFFVKTRF